MKSYHQIFDVYLDGKEIDTISYGPKANVTEEDVKKSLVEHDGYDTNIIVRKRGAQNAIQELKIPGPPELQKAMLDAIREVAQLQGLLDDAYRLLMNAKVDMLGSHTELRGDKWNEAKNRWREKYHRIKLEG